MSIMTLEIDDELLAQARCLCAEAATSKAPLNNNALIQAALEALIHVQAGRQLAALGGSQPDIEDFPCDSWSD